ncbi:hypothetical protein CHS0354_000833 [Potamilus streckersoni]|uniref:Glycosyltransferase n=1 Tax=Potamilus streckersoni TaxID=2493646 RepID=A0AAE0T828_9BIVA|nr:hypothetical protein CHS0354_000833 [Potamilus streckersoni]
MINGVTRATDILASELKSRGHNVIFFVSSYSKLKKLEYFKGFKTYRFFKAVVLPKTGSKIRLAFSTYSRVRRLLMYNKIDIVHCVYPSQLNIVALNVATELGLVKIVHSHHQPENWLKPVGLDTKFFIKINYNILTWIYRKADVVLCPSVFSEEAILKYDPKLNTAVISNGIEIKKFRPMVPDPNFFTTYNIPHSLNILLSVARFAVEKNQILLIRAMKQVVKELPDVFLIFIGTGPTKDVMLKEIEDNGLTNHIRLIDKCPDEDLIHAYNACTLFVHPSLIEMEGLSTLEAMSCRKPILIANSKESATPLFVQEAEGKNGMLFDPDSEKDLVDKIILMLKDNDKLNQMGETGYELIHSKYNISEVVNKIELLYKKIRTQKHHLV